MDTTRPNDGRPRLPARRRQTGGLAAYGPLLASADSWAWSYGARLRIGLCPHGLVKWEANCRYRALAWRERVLQQLRPAQQWSLNLFGQATAAGSGRPGHGKADSDG